MLFENISILDENLEYREGVFVGIEDATIAYVGDAAPADADRFGRRIDGRGKLAMPALYNAHAHAPMTLLRGFAENLPLDRWLNEKCWPFEAKMTPEDNYWATLLACAEMARYGVVSFSDMYYATPERARAVCEAGMKANLCEGLIAFEPKPYAEYPIAAQNEEYVRTLHGSADGRILIDYNIHAEYTSNEQVCRDIVALLRENGLRLHLHLSETKKEVEECRERHGGLSPVEYFDALGAFDVPCTAAHCVWLSDADLDILDRKGVFVANNPVSNMKLGSGFARIPEMLDRGMNVCVGSDGMASNNNHNLFSDLYVMGLIYKGYALDPAAVDPRQVLAAATRMGALSQGRADCGVLAEGYRADICVMDITGPQWCPLTQPLYNVVFAGDGSDVVLTLSDGQVVYERGTWPRIDIERARAEVQARAERIIAEL
ncbi:amidohydrolase [Adlercreutzia murintestinalis]|uniref:amidohydrolase n=1 Tax=Adlercreutzia murintestinalis TaxID=2941325 RepID=UPI00204024FC|nr:amidohydrolase [Adlercreutzia murintestinalis]